MMRIDIGPVQDFPLEEGGYIGTDIAGGDPIAVFRTVAGIYALNDRCTHGNYSLPEGRVEHGAVECPRARLKFLFGFR